MYHHTWAFTFPMKLREVCYGRCFSIAAVLLAVLFSGHRQLDGLGPSAEKQWWYGSDAEVGNPMDDIFHGYLRW